MCLQMGPGITEEQRRQTLLELMESTLAPRKAAANLDMDLIEPVRPAWGQQVCSRLLQRMLPGLIWIVTSLFRECQGAGCTVHVCAGHVLYAACEEVLPCDAQGRSYKSSSSDC